MSKQSVLLFLLVAGASAVQTHFGNIQSSKTKGGSTSFKAAPQSEEYRKLQASNDNVCAAEPICLNTKATYSTIGATVEDGEADQINGVTLLPQSTVWYQFRAPQSGCVTITGCDFWDYYSYDNMDDEMAVYEVGSCSDFTTFTEVAYNDDASKIDPFPFDYYYSAYLRNLTLTPGALYYIQVDRDDHGADEHEGFITLSECTAFEDDFRLCHRSVAVTTNCTAAPSSSTEPPTMDADPCEGKLLKRCMCVTSRNRRRCKRLAKKEGFECTTGPSGSSSCFCKPKQPKRCAARILRRKLCRGLTTAQKRTLAGAFELIYKENCT